ncbi:MAG: DsrE family protein [Deltaproteobacteria bacterium]|nr:DsrE family protein [Deltaproteobacteria bacterium]MCL5892627.1 DsrE family protein [Deltaproteobacteria bacterium]
MFKIRLFLIAASILILGFSSVSAFAMQNPSYGGFYRNYNKPVKIVAGVNMPGQQLGISMLNAKHAIKYLKSEGKKYSIQIVFYGPVVKFLTVSHTKYNRLLNMLRSEGVSFRVSDNALMLNGVNPKNIPHFIKIIPSGTLQIFKKINEGYTYLIAM